MYTYERPTLIRKPEWPSHSTSSSSTATLWASFSCSGSDSMRHSAGARRQAWGSNTTKPTARAQMARVMKATMRVSSAPVNPRAPKAITPCAE